MEIYLIYFRIRVSLVPGHVGCGAEEGDVDARDAMFKAPFLWVIILCDQYRFCHFPPIFQRQYRLNLIR
jgi:hypothetical protein